MLPIRLFLVFTYVCQSYTESATSTDVNEKERLEELYVPPSFNESYTVVESSEEDSDEDYETTEIPELSPADAGDSQSFLITAEQWFNFHLGTLALPVPVNGQELTFKWHVTVYSKEHTPFLQICGGSFVTRSVAISAAHCFWDDSGPLPASQFAVAAGKRYRRWLKLQLHGSNVSEIIIPPRFLGEKTSFQDDIAVVRMETPVPENLFTAKPLCVDFDLALDRKHLTSRNLGTITGFGLTEENGSPSKELNYQNLPYVDIKDCINASEPSFLKYLTGDKICAGDQHTGRALCRGDSGGGLVFIEGNSTTNIPYLRGIASAAPRNNNKCNAFAIGSFTHLRTHRTFLRDHIPGLEEECRVVYAKELAEIAKNRSIADNSKSKEDKPITDRDNHPSNNNRIAPSDNDAKTDINKGDNTLSIGNDHDAFKNDSNKISKDNVQEEITDVNLLKTFPKEVGVIGQSSAPEYQWHTTIYSTAKKPFLQICGGTLVKRDVVISAAHCYKADSRLSSPEQLAAAAGKLHRPWGDPRDEYTQYSEVKQILIHEGFRSIKTKMRSCYQHDLAVLSLSTPFSYAPGVKPACVDFGGEMDREHLMSGSFGKFIGWANTERNCQPNNTLHYRELPYLDLGCIADFSFSNFDVIRDDDVCASLNIILSDERIPDYVRINPPCSSDSGGGLTYLDKRKSNIVPYLRGVATATIEGNPCNHFILDSFTHLRAEKDFLKNVIPGLEEECDVAYPEDGHNHPSSLDMNDIIGRNNVNRTVNEGEKETDSNKTNDRPVSVNNESNPDVETSKALNAPNAGNKDVPNIVPITPNPNLNLYRPLKPIDLNTDRPVVWKKLQTTTMKPTTDINERAFPWHVGVYSKAWMPYTLICSGSVVKRDVVLSAASCFWSDDFGAQSPAQFAIAAGKLQRSWRPMNDDVQYSDVKEIVFPDRFFGLNTNYQADIAVVRLNTPLVYGARVMPICVNFDMETEKQELRNGALGTFVGWGRTEDEITPSLNIMEVPYIEIKECIRNSPIARLRYITNDKICLGNEKTSRQRQLCKSDTGGSLVHTSSYPIIRGINTQKLHDLCDNVTVSLFTHISSHAAFLRENVVDIEGECWNVYENVQIKDLGSSRGPVINLVCNCHCDNSSRHIP